MKRMRKLLAALLALSGSVAFAQVNGKFQNVDAKGGYTVNGAAPNGNVLCGNGSLFVPAASCGAAAFYQTIFNSLGVAQTQEPATQFSANFSLTTSGSKTGIDLAGTITPNTTGNASTATLAANSNAVGGVALSGLCQTGGAGCPTPKLVSGGHLGTTSCSTGSGSFDTCPNNVVISPSMVDTNYDVTCNGQGPNDPRAGISDVHPTSGVTVVVDIVTNGSTVVNFSDISCVAVHR